MFPKYCCFVGLITSFFVIQGCSKPASQERLDTFLCWLRPSCLPSQQPQQTIRPKQPEQTSSRPKPMQTLKIASQNRPTTSCLTSATTTIHASKPSITVSYQEPTTNAKGQALTNLAKTTIYHDVGKGLVKYKEIPATNPQGGGRIQEKISFTMNEGTNIQATICVTATNTHGQEG